MADILIVGNVNVDRVWHLDRPLIAGTRLSYHRLDTRLGGGGFHTARVLKALGHRVVLATRLADDGLGEACRRALLDLDIALAPVAPLPAPTVPAEIFLDPAGERTILGPAARGEQLPGLPATKAEFIYLNMRRLAATVLDDVRPGTRIVAQLPLAPNEQRPAHVLIGSRSDIGPLASPALWQHGRAIAGARLQHIIVTDGPGPVTCLDGGAAVQIPVDQIPLDQVPLDQVPVDRHAAPHTVGITDTTGAGDYFAAGYINGLAMGLSAVATVAHASAIARQWLSDPPPPIELTT